MSDPNARRTLADALSSLIDKKAARDGEHTVTDQAIGEHIGKSRTTVWKLRTGQEQNPKIETLDALAGFFGVKVTYFLDEEKAAAADEQLESLAAARRLQEAAERGGVVGINARLGSLSPESLLAVARLIEQLDEPDGPSTTGA
ncbi:helix-turn-helix domain-containing protein [Umezawaea tangerina]|uniref:Helix-turn-helix protein n=1 Tax=Umezawaea tangerina TaxID=84725 RepID=A0A2T0T7G5_9PSEU|nr:helix-turn-helix transcriptional regulator [Umezawaea tangerina]PRY41597.1 helix-turn-helix protein [Umezawaea tangerina]